MNTLEREAIAFLRDRMDSMMLDVDGLIERVDAARQKVCNSPDDKDKRGRRCGKRAKGGNAAGSKAAKTPLTGEQRQARISQLKEKLGRPGEQIEAPGRVRAAKERTLTKALDRRARRKGEVVSAKLEDRNVVTGDPTRGGTGLKKRYAMEMKQMRERGGPDLDVDNLLKFTKEEKKAFRQQQKREQQEIDDFVRGVVNDPEAEELFKVSAADKRRYQRQQKKEEQDLEDLFSGLSGGSSSTPKRPRSTRGRKPKS